MQASQMALPESCLTEEVLAEYWAGGLNHEQKQHVANHIDRCVGCRKAAVLIGQSSFGVQSETRELGGVLSGEPRTPSMVGRFLIVCEIGRGAMGVVYRAVDPLLERTVAIKQMKTDATEISPAQTKRFLLEGRALAALKHPSIVTIHEVGIDSGRPFLAMEHVTGLPLHDWLCDQPSLPQIFAMFERLARGLVAVHGQGLIHRDIKPSNILVNEFGEPTLVDFGLARICDAPTEIGPSQDETEEAAPLTHQGALVGTPAYASPEQLRGQTATAASDVFGFCATLWEACFAQRPFAATSTKERLALIEGGIELPEDKASKIVPAVVADLLVRGLALEPAHRPTMQKIAEVLAEQGKPVKSHRGRKMLAGAVAVALGVLVFVVSRGQNPVVSECERSSGGMAEVWNETSERELLKSAKDSLILQDAAKQLGVHLTRYAEQWRQESVSACQATNEKHEQSQTTLQQRNACLDGPVRAVRALLTEVSQNPSSLKKVESMLQGLPPIDRCRDVRRLARFKQLLPTTLSAEQDRILQELSDVRVALALESNQDVPAKLLALAERAKREKLLSAENQAYELLAVVYDAQGEYPKLIEAHKKAIWSAMELGAIVGAGRSLAQLALAEEVLGDSVAAADHANQALAIAGRGDLEPVDEADIRVALVNYYRRLAKGEQAAEQSERAISVLRTARLVTEDVRATWVMLLTSQAFAAEWKMQPLRAIAYQTAALLMSSTVNTLSAGMRADLFDRLAMELEVLQGANLVTGPIGKWALRRATQWRAKNSGQRAQYYELQEQIEASKNPAEFMALYDQLFRVIEKMAGPRSREYAIALIQRGEKLEASALLAESLKDYQAALARYQDLPGAFPEHIYAVMVTADSPLLEEKPKEVEGLILRGVDLCQRGGTANAEILCVMIDLQHANLLAGNKQWAEAKAKLLILEKQLSTLTIFPSFYQELIGFSLAQMEWELGNDRPANWAKAAAALSRYENHPDRDRTLPDEELGVMKKWLRQSRVAALQKTN